MLGVLRADGGKEGVEAGKVAGDRDGVDAEVERAEQCGHGTAARTAKGSDSVGVDLWARGEVVDGADPVPGKGAGEGIADEGGLEAGFAVFTGGRFEESLGGVSGVGILEALTLADGVVGEDGEAVAGESAGEGEVGGFAGEAVAGGDDDGWEVFVGRCRVLRREDTEAQ